MSANDAQIARGPPQDVRALAELPGAHPLKAQALEAKAAKQASAAEQAAILAAAADAISRAGSGTETSRLADVEARLAALETFAVDVATA